MLNCIDRWIDRLDGIGESPRSTAETINHVAETLLHLDQDQSPRHIAVVSTLRSKEPERCCSLFVERLRAMGRTACVAGSGDDACLFVFHPCDDILSQERSRPLLQICQETIFVEKLKKSSVPSLQEACSLFREKTEVLGVVLV